MDALVEADLVAVGHSCACVCVCVFLMGFVFKSSGVIVDSLEARSWALFGIM